MGALSGLTGISGLSGVAGSSAWTPAELSLDLWLEARSGTYSDAGSTPAVDTDPIYQWNDLSGNNRNWSQGTLNNRALLKLVSGKWIVESDGTDDFMTLGSDYVIGVTHTLVFAFRSLNTSDQMLISKADANTQWRINANGNAAKALHYDATDAPLSDVFSSAFTDWTVLGFRRVGNTMTFYEGLTARGTGGTILSGGPSMNRMFDYSGGLSARIQCAGIFALSDQLSDDDYASLVDYATGLMPA